MGLRTNSKVKRMGVKSFQKLMDGGVLHITCTQTIEQINNFQENSKGTYCATIGHDDEVTPLVNFAYFQDIKGGQFMNWIEDFYDTKGVELDEEGLILSTKSYSRSKEEDDDLSNLPIHLRHLLGAV